MRVAEHAFWGFSREQGICRIGLDNARTNFGPEAGIPAAVMESFAPAEDGHYIGLASGIAHWDRRTRALTPICGSRLETPGPLNRTGAFHVNDLCFDPEAGQLFALVKSEADDANVTGLWRWTRDRNEWIRIGRYGGAADSRLRLAGDQLTVVDGYGLRLFPAAPSVDGPPEDLLSRLLTRIGIAQPTLCERMRDGYVVGTLGTGLAWCSPRGGSTRLFFSREDNGEREWLGGVQGMRMVGDDLVAWTSREVFHVRSFSPTP